MDGLVGLWELAVVFGLAALLQEEGGGGTAAVLTFAGSVLVVLAGAVGAAFAAYRAAQNDRLADRDKTIADLKAENAELHEEIKEAFREVGELKVEVLVNRKTLLADREVDG